MGGSNPAVQQLWEDLRFPATSINPAGAPGPMGFDTTNIAFTASATGTESVAIVAQIPHAWLEGSDIEPHVHWQPTTTGAGNVVWQLQYKWTNPHEADAGSFTTINILEPAGGTSLRHNIGSFGNISGTGKVISSLLTCIISRLGSDALDTYAATALLKEFDIHYKSDSVGSVGQYSKP